MTFEIEIVAAIVAGAFGVLAFWIGLGVVRSSERSTDRLASLQTRQEMLQEDFSSRAVAPLVTGVGRFAMRFTPGGWAERTNKRLIVSGFAPRFDANSWAALRVLTLATSVVLAFFVQGAVTGTARLGVTALTLVLGFFGPDAVLNRRIEERRTSVERDLPDIIDLLVISVEAGLGFEAALARVVENVPGELSTEFSRMLQETRVGVSRHEAMKALAERTDVDDLNSFIFSMNQAEAFGVSIARMLRVQADEIRVRRRQRAQEKAFAAPVKMVFPLVLCIFPAMFVVLIGPAAIQIVENLNL